MRKKLRDIIDLKIAHLVPPYYGVMKEMGGTARMVYDLVRKQIEQGHELVVLAGPATELEGAKVLSLSNPLDKTGNLIADWLIERAAGCSHVLKSLRGYNFEADIIHNHLSAESIGLSFLRKFPCLATLHGLAYTYEGGLRFLTTKLFSLTRNIKLVAISKSAYFQNRRVYGDDLIGYVHHGIDSERFAFIDKPQKLHDIELCFAGRADPRKGAHLAIEVVETLRKMNYDAHLKLTLKYEPRYPLYFRDVIHQTKIRPYVTCFIELPYVEVASLLGNSDALLFPILWQEPFGLVQLEAMVRGTPVLAFPNGSVPEIIQDGINGFICYGVNEMTSAVSKIDKIDRWKCRKIVCDNFSVDTMYKNYLGFYEKVIEMN